MAEFQKELLPIRTVVFSVDSIFPETKEVIFEDVSQKLPILSSFPQLTSVTVKKLPKSERLPTYTNLVRTLPPFLTHLTISGIHITDSGAITRNLKSVRFCDRPFSNFQNSGTGRCERYVYCSDTPKSSCS